MTPDHTSFNHVRVCNRVMRILGCTGEREPSSRLPGGGINARFAWTNVTHIFEEVDLLNDINLKHKNNNNKKKNLLKCQVCSAAAVCGHLKSGCVAA